MSEFYINTVSSLIASPLIRYSYIPIFDFKLVETVMALTIESKDMNEYPDDGPLCKDPS